MRQNARLLERCVQFMRKSDIKLQLYQTRLHEAGHAVALIINNKIFSYVKVTKHRDGETSGMLDGWFSETYTDKKMVENNIICYMAGPISEMYYSFHYSDPKGLLYIIKKAKGNTVDLAGIKFELDYFKKVFGCDYAFKEKEFLLRLVRKTIKLVKENKENIMDVVKMFEKKNLLSYDRILDRLLS